MNIEPVERTVQDDQPSWPDITSAIGRVVATSAWATIALQEMAAAVAGSDMLYFLMEDATMGTQIKQTKALIEGPERWTSMVDGPPLTRESRDAALDCLSLLAWLTPFRNRIVHDAWYPDERLSADGVLGRRATRFGRLEVLSRRATFHRIAYSFFLATKCLNETTLAVHALRDRPAEGFGTTHLQNATAALTTLAARRQASDRGRDPDWLWSQSPLHVG